jgi:hypothetical protein
VRRISRTALVVAAAWLLAACSWGAPEIEVATAYDMGTVLKGDPAVADLVVRNVGNRPLNVQAVSTSCGCTKATLTPMFIPPGGEAGLHVEYDSGAHAVDLGPVERFVFISSDDPEKGEVRIRFTVIVQPKPDWRSGRWLDGRNAVFSQSTQNPLSRQSIGAIHDQEDT